MRCRVFTVVLGLLVGVLVGVTPAPSVAATRHVPMRVEHVTAGVTATKVFELDRPADHLAVYWRGNPHAHVSLAFSPGGSRFSPGVSAGRDEVGLQRQNGTTYGAIHDSIGTVAVRVSSDRPIVSSPCSPWPTALPRPIVPSQRPVPKPLPTSLRCFHVTNGGLIRST